MQSTEIAATGELAAEGFGGLITRIQELHAAVADRAFENVGPAATPVRAAHAAISTGVYKAVHAAGAFASVAAGRALATTAAEDAPAFADSARGGLLVGTLNGFLGDRLAERDHGLSVGMTVRAQGRQVTLDHDGLAAAYQAASPRIAVFLHGLCESENAWLLGTAREDGPRSPTYGECLQAELGYTSVLIRYNSGRRISDNGAQFAALLEDLVAGWPVEVEQVVLIGHSMGALVARSACHHATEHAWPSLVTHTISLGAPHLGAPLEQRVNRASRALHRIPETRPIASFLDLRSNGIRDLRHGALVDADWSGFELDDSEDRCTDVPLLEGPRHCVISATLHRDPEHLTSRLLGDLLVLQQSATGNGPLRRIAFEADNLHHVGGINHFKLLNHPAVYDQLRAWLSEPAQ